MEKKQGSEKGGAMHLNTKYLCGEFVVKIAWGGCRFLVVAAELKSPKKTSPSQQLT